MTKYLNPLTIPDPNCCKGPELCQNCARKAMDIRNALTLHASEEEEDELVYNCPEDVDPDEDQDMAPDAHYIPAAQLGAVNNEDHATNNYLADAPPEVAKAVRDAVKFNRLREDNSDPESDVLDNEMSADLTLNDEWEELEDGNIVLNCPDLDDDYAGMMHEVPAALLPEDGQVQALSLEE